MRKLLLSVAVLGFAVATASADNQISASLLGSPNDANNSGYDWSGGIGAVLHDDGDTNGANGISNAHQSVFGFRRTVLDDFVVTDQAGWRVNDFHWLHIWTNGGGPKGTGAELRFRADAGGAPGAPGSNVTVTSYVEAATGRSWFSRPEMRSSINFNPVNLAQGTYWVEWTVLGPENNFAMVRNINPKGQAAWVDYADFGGLQPGRNVFGVDYYLAFVITGDVIPEPATLVLLGMGGLALIRRRR